MIAFIKLTRPLNLLIIALTMAAMRYGVVGGYLQLQTRVLQAAANAPHETMLAQVPGNVFHHAFSNTLFWLLVLSTVLVAAAGNIINDYFDTRIDRINRPDGVIVGRTVKRRVAMAAHIVITTVGVLLGLFVAWRAGHPALGAIPVLAATALWLYNTGLKRTFLLGNGVVAVLSAMVPLTVGLYEVPALAAAYPSGPMARLDGGGPVLVDLDFNTPWYVILLFSFFAFLTTLVRELQKDMADMPGDRADGRRTIPLVLGPGWSKAIALAYIAITLLALLFVRMRFLSEPLSYWYVGIGIMAPLLLSAGFTYNANDRRAFTIADHLMKLTMALAIAYAFLLGVTVWDLR